MIFLGSNEDCDKEIIQHYLDNRVLIDRQTGDSICFIHFITDVPVMAGSESRKDLILREFDEFRTMQAVCQSFVKH